MGNYPNKVAMVFLIIVALTGTDKQTIAGQRKGHDKNWVSSPISQDHIESNGCYKRNKIQRNGNFD